jgi:hypothetical protein
MKVCQLIQQCILSRVVEAATASQAVHCARQLLDRCPALARCDECVGAILRELLLDAPRGIAQRERSQQRVCK